MSGLKRQAKTLTDAQVRAALAAAKTPTDRAMILLSVKAGLRACEIAALAWTMVCDAEGEIADRIALPNVASKGKKGGREIPLHADLRAALEALGERQGRVIKGRRDRLTAHAVVIRFATLYRSLGFEGASSHSGRRTFITKAARKITEAGGSMRDVQQLAGHTSLSTTQIYVEGSTEAKRKVVALL